MAEIELRARGIDGVIDTLRSLPPEIVSKRGGPAKTALRKGARVILLEALLNLARATESLASDDQKGTGLLIKNVVVTRGKAPFDGNGERYLVRVRRRTYPRSGESSPTTTHKTANLLEYGSEHQPAEPWLRPAFASKAAEAISTVETELVKGIDRIVRKLAAKNRGR